MTPASFPLSVPRLRLPLRVTVAVGLLAAVLTPGSGVRGGEKEAVPEARQWVLRPIAPGGASDSVDGFVRAGLAAEGLALSPEADRRTLIRRLYFDLIGLPPSPEEVRAFINDSSPQAWERLVDRLLASPRHGERYARHWLDVVRFAETSGFETNLPRPNAWRYRDWVIQAFAGDLPYDQFVTSQLAGDVADGGADEATGFLTGGADDAVKSPDPVLTANQRADELHDMVSTTGSAFMGLTVGCARCHAHKFDPIPQEDYYAVKAVFEGVRHGERPLKKRDDPGQQAEVKKLKSRLAALDARLAELEPMAMPPAATAGVSSMPPGSPPARPAVTAGVNVDRFPPAEAKWLRFTIDRSSGAEPCLDELEVFTAEAAPQNVACGAALSSTGDYAGNPAHCLAHLTDGKYGNDFSWISNAEGKGRIILEFAGLPRIDRVVWSRDRSPEARYRDRLALSYRIEISRDGQDWQAVAASFDRLPQEAAAAAAASADPPNAAGTTEWREIREERKKAAAELVALSAPAMAYCGKMEEPAPTRRLQRGDPMDPREEIAPHALSAVPVSFSLPPGAHESDRRLALARWLTDPANPLTARVIVNRLWQWHFGEGIVSTPGDFGANGARPTHPELLDWLAGQLIRRRWSLREVDRLILLSAAYRQSSATRPEGMAADAGCRLLWRFPAHRLEAESIRDSILAVSGALNPAAGGPGFSTFQPNENYVRVYNPKTTFGPDDFRRMIYLTKVRMQAEPTFGVFDCPDAGQTAPRRGRSTTPLQALNLLNSPFLMQQAEIFATRLVRESGPEPGDQLRLAFQLCYQRDPAPAEREACGEVLRNLGLPAVCRALLNSNEFLQPD